jgi:hypothetical protein
MRQTPRTPFQLSVPGYLIATGATAAVVIVRLVTSAAS